MQATPARPYAIFTEDVTLVFPTYKKGKGNSGKIKDYILGTAAEFVKHAEKQSGSKAAKKRQIGGGKPHHVLDEGAVEGVRGVRNRAQLVAHEAGVAGDVIGHLRGRVVDQERVEPETAIAGEEWIDLPAPAIFFVEFCKLCVNCVSRPI